MDKKILFITESNFNGKYDRDFKNSRTEIAWMIALNADHMSINSIDIIGKFKLYDLIILIIPKDIDKIYNNDKLEKNIKIMLKENGKFTAMQEGPRWYFQDYSIEKQNKYYSMLLSCDFLLCHNDADVYYYSGITNKPTYILQSLMIEDTIGKLENKERKNVIIGGNHVSWYGGFDSTIVANEFECDNYAPIMGRMKDEEVLLKNINHIKYKTWTDWIIKLNEFKYAVHLMPTHAAGTFALNTAYLGIPTIGYYGLDTQQMLHPSLTVELGDIIMARKFASELKNDKEFYEYCSNESKHMYSMFYTEDVFVKQFEKILEMEKI